MLVFIDESGCSGFKLARGADAVFAIGMVIFDDRESAWITEQRISSFRAHRGYVREFKFSKSSNRLRDEFFATVRSCPFRVRALVVEKAKIHDVALRLDDRTFYDFFMDQLVQRAASTLWRESEHRWIGRQALPACLEVPLEAARRRSCRRRADDRFTPKRSHAAR
jgi:hypothetical protein